MLSEDARAFAKFRETPWVNAKGESRAIRNMDDEHIINIIWWIAQNVDHYEPQMLQNFLHEANFRELEWAPPTSSSTAVGKAIQAPPST